MEWSQIKNQIKNITEFSKLVFRAIDNSNILFDYIEQLPNDVKQTLYEKYNESNGPILAIRKKVVNQFLTGKINRKEIITDFETGKSTNPKGYTQYKNLFSILYPFVITETNNQIYSTLKQLAENLGNDLGLQKETEIKVNGFDGGRNTGDDHAWFAIYNSSHPDQKTAKQLFFSIHNGNISYSLYDRKKDIKTQEQVVAPENIEYEDVLNLFSVHKNYILLDNYRSNLLSKYPIGELIKNLNSGKINTWLIKPGQKGFMWKQVLKEGNIRIGWGNVITDLYSENNFDDNFILEKLNEYDPKEVKQTNNRRSIISFLKNIKIGDIVFAVSGKSDIIGIGVITSDTILDEKIKEYRAFHKVDWLVDISANPYNPEYDLAIKTVTALQAKYSVPIIKSIFNFTSIETSKMEYPSLNTILYGPPGTGKTYELNKYKSSLFTDIGVTKTPEDLLREKLITYPFWKVIAGVVSQSKNPLSVTDIVQNAIVKAKLNPYNKSSPQSKAWSELQSYADDKSTQLDQKYRRSIKLFSKDNASKWSIAENKKDDIGNIIDQKPCFIFPKYI